MNGSDPAILFKAEFTNLAGSGMVKLASTLDQTGIRASLDQLDLSRMNTKPFEPKLPLPEAFESQLMKSAIAQLQPIVNKYLTEKPLFLPDHVAPLAASPVLHLWSIGNSHSSKLPFLSASIVSRFYISILFVLRQSFAKKIESSHSKIF